MLKAITCLISILSLLLLSCSGSKNYEKAWAFEKDGKYFIKIKGKRNLAAHDLGSLYADKTYEDSLVLQVPSLRNGTIDGNDIPVKKGYYKYLGSISIEDNKLQVNLSYDNTDDKKVEPISWNGKYHLVRTGY